MRKFCQAPAGVKNHHAYLGGLLEHVVGLMDLVRRLDGLYPDLNTDLLLMGAFLHDIGKIDELAYDREFAYTDEGQLIGHLVMAVGILDRKLAEAEQPVGRTGARGAGAAAEAHDRQPSRAVRIRQPQAAHDAGSRGAAPARQPRRQAAQLRAIDARRSERRQLVGPTSIPAWAASCSRAQPLPSAGRPRKTAVVDSRSAGVPDARSCAATNES